MKDSKKNIDIAFLAFENLSVMSIKEKIRYLIDTVKAGKILIIDGKLDSEEETNLISETMKNVNEEFPGIELSSMSIEDTGEKSFVLKLKRKALEVITGRRRGFTIIGPARIIKEIKSKKDQVSILMQ